MICASCRATAAISSCRTTSWAWPAWRHDAREGEPRGPRDLERAGDHEARRLPRSRHAAVHLDHDRQRDAHPAGEIRVSGGDLGRIGHQGEPAVGGEALEPLQLGGAEGRVGQQDVVAAALGHHLGLRRRGDAQAPRTGGELPLRHREALVGLHVRAEREAVAVRELLHAADVPLGHVQVDEDRGGVEPRVAHGDRQGGARGQWKRWRRRHHPHRRGHSAMTAVFSCPNPRRPSTPFSRPWPERLNPPNGSSAPPDAP